MRSKNKKKKISKFRYINLADLEFSFKFSKLKY